MKRDWKLYWKLFMSTFLLSAFTFGGGYVIVPLMRKKFVDELNWIEEREMLDLTAIAQSSPGAIAINASILVGYRIAGYFGAFITVFGTVLPPLVIISVISLFYEAFRDNVTVNALLKGMEAGVAAVICDVVFGMGSSVVRKKDLLSILIMAGAFIAAYFFHINVMIIILLCGLIGMIAMLYRQKQERSKSEE